MKDDLKQLLELSAQKDQLAFKKLYEQTSSKLYPLALSLLKREVWAEEVLQDAYVKIWNKADQYNPERGSVFTWMMIIVRNQAYDKLRYTKIRPQSNALVYEDFEHPSMHLQPDENLTVSQQIEQLITDMHSFKEEQKQCVLLSHLYGYTHSELSEMLDKPLGTVKAWIRRAHQQLQPSL